jgi:hypothetical protein
VTYYVIRDVTHTALIRSSASSLVVFSGSTFISAAALAEAHSSSSAERLQHRNFQVVVSFPTMQCTLPATRIPRATCPVPAGGRRLAVSVRAAAPKTRAPAAAEGKDVTGLSSLRFAKPSASEMEGLMNQWTRWGLWHDFVCLVA